MSDGTADERHEAAHTDEDPLLNSEQASFLTRIRRSLPSFTVRRWRRTNSADGESEPVSSSHDIESGDAGQAAHADAASSPEAGSSRETRGEGAASSQDSAERESPGSSPTARQGFLGELLRLGSAALPRSSNSGLNLHPTCLICLEQLAPEDFENGEAIILECQCRGDMAMRHRTCAEKWAHVKGNRICDICKTVVKNLPEVTPRAPDSASTQNGNNSFDESDAARNNAHLFAADQVPGGADVVFDCIRVTWVAMIICILFFEMSLANALWTGLIIGLAYTLFVRAMYRHQLAVMMREQQRLAGETPVHQHVVHVV